MAIGAIIALQQAGIAPKTKCVGAIDGTPDALSEMGKENLYGTVFQDAKGQGQSAVDAAIKLPRAKRWTNILSGPPNRSCARTTSPI
jgi:inositol transport system substrate-binding protein